MSFTHILNLSISASWLVLAIIGTRFVLKHAPKSLHCALWALVAFRLLCPISIESELSLLPTREVIPQEYLAMEPMDDGFSQAASVDLVTNPVYDTPVSIAITPTVDRVQHWDMIATILWLTGIGAMTIYAAYSYLSLRLRVRFAARLQGNVFECDEIDSPFVLGLIRPRIYLPSGLDETTREHVLAHETAHLKRLDHLWKPLGFALLAIHWFNPVMWLGYILLCRDIELACDERVIKKLSKSDVRAYSESLIRCTVPHRSIALCPLAFGEVGVKGRIKAMVHYRKPGFWIISSAIVAAAAIALCFLTDPAITPDSIAALLERRDCAVLGITEQTIKLEIRKDDLPADVHNGRKHRFDEAPILLAEFDDTTLSLIEARMSGDELLLTIETAHTLAQEGTVLLPYHPYDGDENPDASVRMAHADVADAETVFGDAAVLRGKGRESFSVGIKLDTWNQAKDYIRFHLSGLYSLEYALGYHMETTQIEYLDTVRIFRAEGLPAFTAPEFQLHSDGTFRMIENAFTSYHGFGAYTREDGVLELRTDDGRFCYRFTEEDGAYIYDKANSSEIRYYLDARNAASLPDGTKFTISDRLQFAAEELDAAICSNLQMHYCKTDADGRVNAVSYRILDYTYLSGTPLEGTTEHTTRLTLYLAAQCGSYLHNGATLSEEIIRVTNLSMTFLTNENGLELIGLLDSEGNKLSQVYSPEALEIWNTQEEVIREHLSSQCMERAEQVLFYLDLDKQIGSLLDVICSSPGQSSNPGAYIEAHREEYDRLVSLGADTVRYCFAKFAEGGQIDLTGHVMALCCREILDPMEDTWKDGVYMTGQEWFDAFAANAKLLLEANDADKLQNAFPYHALALEILGYI